MNNSLYTPLIAGIDTLEAGYCVAEYKLTDEEWASISEAKESAQANKYDKGSVIQLRGFDFLVRRTGSTRYNYILSNDDVDICIQTEANSGRGFPETKVKLSSAFLWRNGYQQAISKVDDFIRSIADITETKISRVDIAFDIMSDFPDFTPELTEIITRAKKRKEYGKITIDYEKHLNTKDQETLSFGKGEVMFRLYDKTKEILSSNKQWFEYLWTEKEWVKGQTVLRAEFQCRRKTIRKFQIETVSDLILILPDMWKYLTEEWLTIRVITNDSHRTRWPISEFWKVIQGAGPLFGELTGVSRLKQMRPKFNRLEMQLNGLASSMAACAAKSLSSADVSYGVRLTKYRIQKLLDNPEFEEEVRKKIWKYASMDY